MKRISVSVLFLTPILAIGCVGKSPTAQNEDSRVTPEKTSVSSETSAAKVAVAGEADHSFSLSVPFETIAMTQGGQAPVKIGINRGLNFDEEVNIEVSGLPTGVTLEKENLVIDVGSQDATLVLEAASNAALGDFSFKVTGHTASSGADFSRDIKLKISQN